MKKRFLYFLLIFLSSTGALFSQGLNNSDNAYKVKLTDLIRQIEFRFHVIIRCPEDMAPQVDTQWVPYGQWRLRNDFDRTVENVFIPLDLKLVADGKEKGRYKIKQYEYYRWLPEDGYAYMQYLGSHYHDRDSWQLRGDSLKMAIRKALRLDPMPNFKQAQPILNSYRKYDGYSVENFALETLPGFYICGSIYRPLKSKGRLPLVLSPDGHWKDCRYRPDCQYRCATLARLGCIAVSYDLFAWGESLLQFKDADHRRSLSETLQIYNSFRILDYMLTRKDVDTDRVAISGGSGGGTLTMLVAALDNRIKVAAPVVSLSCYMFGGCPCESGMPGQLSSGGTDNPEIASLIAPRPLLIVSDGHDWTDHVPQWEYPFLQHIYGYYGDESLVENVHLPLESHDYGINKRKALYGFLARRFRLDLKRIEGRDGQIDESPVTIEPNEAMYVFGKHGELLPKDAIHGFDTLVKEFNESTQKH